jgi:4a-hydroxytetrahydrobiopterin dehydratase
VSDELLLRPAASAAVESVGWRLLLRAYAASVPVAGLEQGLQVAAAAAAACGGDSDDHLRIDVRADRVELVLQTRAANGVTALDAELAAAVTAAVHGAGLAIAPATGRDRPAQMLELAIDAMDIGAIRPFWKAVLNYVDEPGAGPDGAIADPAGQLPAIWFQQMDEPRPQRNRIHFDLDVGHDEAHSRIQDALAAGGVLVSDAAARAFWVLADAEGNEVCVCTWQDRD